MWFDPIIESKECTGPGICQMRFITFPRGLDAICQIRFIPCPRGLDRITRHQCGYTFAFHISPIARRSGSRIPKHQQRYSMCGGNRKRLIYAWPSASESSAIIFYIVYYRWCLVKGLTHWRLLISISRHNHLTRRPSNSIQVLRVTILLQLQSISRFLRWCQR